MKRFIIFLIAIQICSFSYAQDKPDDEIRTIFGDLKSKSNGGYGSFSIMFQELGGLETYINGGRGGWIINNRMVLGIAGYGFDTEAHYDQVLEYDCRLSGGYGGLLIEGIIAPHSSIHLSVPVIIGGGAVSYRKYYKSLQEIDTWHSEDTEAFWVIQSGLEIEINLLKFLRLGIGGFYRYTTDFDLNYDIQKEQIEGLENGFMNGVIFGVTFKFGKF